MTRSSIPLPSTPTPTRAAAAQSPSATVLFAIAALGVGAPFLALSTIIKPDAPFLLSAVLLGLALPALVITHREAGGAAVRALLRDCVRLPSSWWWLPLAGLGLPIVTWTTGAALGGAQPMTWGLAAFYVGDLVTGALIINIWEEMAWTGFFQRRAASRWGTVGGALVTSVFFTAIHVPLALADAHGVREIAVNLIGLAGVATGVRLLIARLDPWCGRSLLTIGVLHSSFNASETLLDADHFWVRIAVTVALGVGLVAFGKEKIPAG